MPFDEAEQAAEVRSILLTTGRSADLRRLEPTFKRRAMMSATVEIASRLQGLAHGVDAILRGDTDQDEQSAYGGIHKRVMSGLEPSPELGRRVVE